MFPIAVPGWKIRLALVLMLPAPVLAAPAALPPGDDAMHMGVATCASSVCHGAAAARESGNILQNEYLTWQRDDPHAGAWRRLLDTESAAIVKRLGLGPAESEPLCLGCHADNAVRTGEKFRRDDGIGCETCHGGAENWIESHAAEGRSHADNLADGLYPLEEPAARASLCQSCHVGDEQRPMLHELLGAGHPPLLFELDTFSAILPQHYRKDDDYRERKGNAGPVDFWLAGQLEQASRYLAQLDRDHHRGKGRAWPDFANYNCQGCHHTIESDPARPAQPARSGLPPLRTAPLQSLADVAVVLAGADGAAFRDALGELREQPERAEESLPEVHETFATLRDSLHARAGVNRATWRSLLLAVTDPAAVPRGRQGRELLDHRVMSVGVLLQAGRKAGWLNAAETEELSTALDRSYSLLRDPYDFNAYAVRVSLLELHKLAEQLD